MQLFWHRRDPRTRDNVGLAAAARTGTVVPVFVYDTDLFGTMGARQRAFFLRHVKRLKERYREFGSDLVVRAGDPEKVLVDLADEYDAEAVFYNEYYRPARRNRQRAVEGALEGFGVETNARTDAVLVDPGRLEERYANHGRFHDEWETVPKPEPSPEPDADALVNMRDEKRSLRLTPTSTPTSTCRRPATGPHASGSTASSNTESGRTPTRATTLPGPSRRRRVHAVSRMSPYLATGAIGIREMWADATDAFEAATGDERRNVDKYRDELSWREQMYHLLYYTPIWPSRTTNRSRTRSRGARTTRRSRRGRAETGYPLVDAGMRQLNAEGTSTTARDRWSRAFSRNTS